LYKVSKTRTPPPNIYDNTDTKVQLKLCTDSYHPNQIAKIQVKPRL